MSVSAAPTRAAGLISASNEEALCRAAASAVQPEVGSDPLLLLGSRAVGSGGPQSDWDLAVVVPAWRIPSVVPRLQRARRRAEARLGVPVSLNPIPRSRLEHPRRSLYLLKVNREAVVLSAPCGISLDREARVEVSEFAKASYVIGAVLAVLASVEPERPDGPELASGIRKAVLHLAQLRMLDDGRYAPSLGEALRGADDAELVALARHAGAPDALATACRLLLSEAARRPLRVPAWKLPVRNAQFSVLAALRGRPRWRVLGSGRAVEVSLATALLSLLEAASTPGMPVPNEALRWLAPVPGSPPTWREARDEVMRGWQDAHPLAGALG